MVFNNKEKSASVAAQITLVAPGTSTPSSSGSDSSDEADKKLEAMGYTPVRSLGDGHTIVVVRHADGP